MYTIGMCGTDRSILNKILAIKNIARNGGNYVSKKISLLILALVLIIYTMLLVSCASLQVKQFGV